MIKKLFTSIRQFFKRLFRFQQRPFVYAALGDSTVEGFGASHPSRTYPSIIYATLQDSYKKSTLDNLGKAGARVHDVVTQQLDKAISLQPDLVTLSIGANDIRKATRLSSFARDLETILKRLKDETTAHVVMNNIPDLSLAPAIPRNLRAISKLQVIRFNKKIAALTTIYDVTLVDLFTQTKIYAKHYPEIVYEDGFHPSDFGYAIWANSILVHIRDSILHKKKQASVIAN